ncbi:unnamed protein product [Trichobilharzia regenti]|nr:unnamed protein product [Trichobilharzia regenti]
MEQLLPSNLRIHCTLRLLVSREFQENTSLPRRTQSSNLQSLSSNNNNNNTKQDKHSSHPPIITLISNRLRSLGFSGRRSSTDITAGQEQSEQQHRSTSAVLLSDAGFHLDTEANSVIPLPLNNILEWTRSQLKPLLVM